MLLPLVATLLAVASPLAQAQDGLPATADASAPPTGSPYDINLEGWDVLTSGSFEQMFGTVSKQRLTIDLQFNSETVLWGKKITKQSNTITLWWIGPFFGGEGYTGLEALVPWDQNAANQFALRGGWKYRVFEYVDLDVGGNNVLYTRRTYGPGILATNFGRRYRGNAYVGLIGRTVLTPSIYAIYDTSLEQLIVQGGLFESIPIGQYVELPGLRLDLEGKLGWLHANKWLGKDLPFTGQNWGNTYWFGEVKADLIYEFENGLQLNAGIRYSGNTDGTGLGFPFIDLGPDQMVWFGAGLQYTF